MSIFDRWYTAFVHEVFGSASPGTRAPWFALGGRMNANVRKKARRRKKSIID